MQEALQTSEGSLKDILNTAAESIDRWSNERVEVTNGEVVSISVAVGTLLAGVGVVGGTVKFIETHPKFVASVVEYFRDMTLAYLEVAKKSPGIMVELDTFLERMEEIAPVLQEKARILLKGIDMNDPAFQDLMKLYEDSLEARGEMMESVLADLPQIKLLYERYRQQETTVIQSLALSLATTVAVLAHGRVINQRIDRFNRFMREPVGQIRRSTALGPAFAKLLRGVAKAF